MPLEPEVRAKIDLAVAGAEEHLDAMLKDPKLKPGIEAMLTLHLAHYLGGTHKYLGQMYVRRAKELASDSSGKE